MTSSESPLRSVANDVITLPSTFVRFVVEAVRWLIVDPISVGRVRLDRRSPGVRAMALSAMALTGLMLLLIVGAPALRSSGALAVTVAPEGTSSVPRSIVWVFVLVIAVFIALIQAAALHAAVWFRVASMFTVSLMLLSIGAIDSVGGMSLGVGVAIGAVGALVVLQAARWHGAPVWWEPLVVLAVASVVLAVVYSRSGDVAGAFGLDRAPLLTDSILTSFRLLSTPLAVVAGVAVAKVALSAMMLVTDFSRRRFTPTGFGVIVVAVVAWRTVRSLLGWLHDLRTDAAAMLATFADTSIVVALVVGIWWVTRRVGRSAVGVPSRQQRVVDIGTVVDRVDDVAIPAAVLITILTIPTVVVVLIEQSTFAVGGPGHWLTGTADDVASFLLDDDVTRWLRIGVGVMLVGVGQWLARQGRSGMAELTAVVGAVLAITYVSSTGLVVDDVVERFVYVDRIGVVVAAGFTVVWAMRRAITPERLAAVMLLVLVASLFSERDFVSNPLTSLIGTSGIALVLFGFVWTFLAEAGSTGIDSARFPRDSRLLLFCGQALFGLAVLAWVALSRDPASGLTLNSSSDLGDATLGVGLLATAYLTVLQRSLQHGGSSRAAPGW